MATTINADNGVSSGSAGLKETADSSGVLALQTNGTTAVSISTGQVVTLTNALPIASGGTGTTSTTFANLATNVTGTLPVGNGGTGLTTATGVLVGAGSSVSAVAAGTNGNVLTSNGTTWVSQAAGGTAPVYTVVTTPGTWTKPATVKAIQVTVVGGGGTGGSAIAPASGNQTSGAGGGGGGGASIISYPAPSLPGPQPYTVGGVAGTSSFGVAPAIVVTATGGATASNATNSGNAGGAGGVGSNGNINIAGSGGNGGSAITPALNAQGGVGGSSILGGGGPGPAMIGPGGTANGVNGGNYGGGGSGGCVQRTNSPATAPGGTGASGVIIIEEFY